MPYHLPPAISKEEINQYVSLVDNLRSKAHQQRDFFLAKLGQMLTELWDTSFWYV